jgi:hypothetical protein
MKKIFSTLCLFIAVAATTVSCSSDDSETASSLASVNAFEIAIANVDAATITYDLGSDIKVSVPYGTSLTAVVPAIGISENSTITPASGETITFVDGEAKSFTVTAEDGTTKIYTATINVRAEVGSGSRLKSYLLEDLYGENSTTTYTYNDANFVKDFTKEVDEWGDITTTTYTLVYNNDNEVIEEKSEAAKVSTVYTYNSASQISTAVYKDNAVLTYTYAYEYDEAGNLTSEKRTDHTSQDDITEVKFTIVNGNVTVENRYGEDYVASYDANNNPFKGIYPAAYAAINVGVQAVNTNNPINGTFTEGDGVAYEYNTDNYPISAYYTYFDGFATVSKTYTYYAD